MDETASDLYEEWHLAPVITPARTTLYALPPVGMGTPWVESLTSYITRLAFAHCVFVGDLMSTLIAPLVPGYVSAKNQQVAFRDGGKQSALFNGVGLPATYAVQALQVLTLRTDLLYLTLLPLAAVIPAKPKGLIRLRKAWCPACYEEWRLSGQTVYDPLLWSFQEITHCTHHRQGLRTCCPYQDCTRSLPGVAWRARVGYCSYCQRWLGTTLTQAEERAFPQEADWQQWVTEALGTMLAPLPGQKASLVRERIGQVVAHLLEQLFAGDLPAFAHTLGLSRNTVYYWCQGENLPEIGMLLRMCYRLGLSLSEFLFAEVATLRPPLSNSAALPPAMPKKKLPLQEEEVYHILDQATTSDEQPPPALVQVASRVGHTHPILYRIHPAACHTIVARYKAHVQQRKEARLQRFREEIRQIALKLHADGEPLTQKRIARYLSQSGALRDPRVREVLREVCQEIEENV
jgi:transcriptional regulator with XRE-family HTH domain